MQLWLLVKIICDALRDLVPFAQFKKPEKHPWRSVTFSKVAGFCGTSKGFMKAKPFKEAQKPATLPKVTLLHGFVSRFLNCTNGKLRKTSHLSFKMSITLRYFNFELGFDYELLYSNIQGPYSGDHERI